MGNAEARVPRSVVCFLAALLLLMGASDRLSKGCAAQGLAPTTAVFVDGGRPVALDESFLVGTRTLREACLRIESARSADAPEHGLRYISIGLAAGRTLAAGDSHVTLTMGLERLNEYPAPMVLSVRVGTQHYDFAFEDGRVVFRGVMLDAVRYEVFDSTLHEQTIPLDGSPFTLELARQGDEVLVLLEGQLLQRLWMEPTQGEIGVFVERANLLRAGVPDDILAALSVYDFRATGHFAEKSAERARWEEQVGSSMRLLKRVGNAFGYVEDDPGLPNVLLIGDSISIYYTDPVRRLLSGLADVYRTPMGPGKAETLFESLTAFLAERRWDVIHFNTGLHDLAGKEGTQDDLDAYRENLEVIVAKLEQTGARLVWASTTPVPAEARGSHKGVEVKYNRVADEVMQAHGIPVDDLYSAVLPHHDRFWLAPDNVHFNTEGSAFLGRQVAEAVRKELAALN